MNDAAAAVTIVTAVHASLLGELWAVCFYSKQPGTQLLLAQASMFYALIVLSNPQPALLPGEVIAGSGAVHVA